MSMHYLIIECSQCAFNGSGTLLWGRYEYETPDGLLPVDRKLGWCFFCNGIAPLERLPNTEEIQAKADRVAAGKATIESYKRSAKLRQSPLKKLFGIDPKLPEELISLGYSCSILEDTIVRERVLLSALRERKSPPRCLICGTERIERFLAEMRITDDLLDSKRSFSTGSNHVDCGGKLMYRASDLRASKSLKHRIYDCEGLLLQEHAPIQPYITNGDR